MKKISIFLCAVFVLASVSARPLFEYDFTKFGISDFAEMNRSVAPFELQAASESASMSSTSQYYQARTWKIGDIYDVNGVKGVVFILSADRQHGTLLSFTQTYDDWDDAEAWCASLGEGWTLPSRDELKYLNLAFNKISEVLEREGYEWLQRGEYWTRECYDGYTAGATYVSDRSINHHTYNKYNTQCRVRAVRKF